MVCVRDPLTRQGRTTSTNPKCVHQTPQMISWSVGHETPQVQQRALRICVKMAQHILGLQMNSEGLVQKQGRVRPHMACCQDAELAYPLWGEDNGTNACIVLIGTLPCVISVMCYVYLCASRMQYHHPAFTIRGLSQRGVPEARRGSMSAWSLGAQSGDQGKKSSEAVIVV